MARKRFRPNVHQVIARVERQHLLIEGLQSQPRAWVPGRALGQRLGVSTRTIERDLADLRSAGVPIEVKKGLGGGYRLEAPLRIEPVSLTLGEVAALVASLVAVGPYSSATAVSVLEKLRDAMTPNPRNGRNSTSR